MTTTKNHSITGEFELGHYRFHRDDQQRLVFIPSGPDLDGYLAFDQKEKDFVQVRLLKTEDAEKREIYKTTWEQIRDKNDCNICPEILAYGEEDEVPYYVSSLPAGEPVSFFVKRGGPLPPEAAAKMVLKFLRSLKAQDPIAYEKHEMAPETLWISRGTGEPRIILGDFSPVPGAKAEAVNSRLCLDLLKYLSGNPPFNEVFQTLISVIEKGPQTLGFMIDKLEEYAKDNPALDFWTDYNQPSPILNQLVEPHVAMQSVVAEPDNETVVKMPLDRPLWQYILGIGAAAILFGILAAVGMNYVSNDKQEPLAAIEPETDKPVVKVPPVKNEPVPEPTLQSFPEPVVPGPEAASLPEVASSDPEDPVLPMAPVKDQLPPVPLVDEEEEIAAKPLEPIETAEGIFEIEPEQPAAEPEVKETEVADAISSPEIVLPEPDPAETPVKQDALEEIMKQLANEASLARANNETFKAIEKEIDLLKLSPKAADAKLRLNSDLVQLQENPGRIYEADELDVIKKTAAHNPKAHEILVQHFRNTGNWNFEIDALVKHGRSGRPDKLCEAGERIFNNPLATRADHGAARGYFVEAAKLGHSGAQFFAGECMILGRGGSKDLAQGTINLRKAIDQGDARAMDLLGVCHVRGWGVERDDARAVDLFRAAVEAGNIPAYYNLGARYAQGQGVERDPAKAAELFAEGSKKGNAHCMLVFARCLEAGYGQDQDMDKAKYWFSKSAEKGNPEAIEWCEEHNHDYLKFLADS